LSFNRPAARNAISRQLLAELTQQINSIHHEGETGATRALILASDVDSSFCAGADLKERATFTQEEYVSACPSGPFSQSNEHAARQTFLQPCAEP
jgi:enoyl-CoA hydratase/carnithine racemase